MDVQHAFPMGNPEQGGYDGMTLRDWFAGQALIGLITHAQDINHDGWSYRTGTLAGDAYAFADDMMIARKASHDQ